MKKIIMVLLLLFSIFALEINVSADMGPKPSTTIKIEGIEGKYIAAFAATSAFGPNYDYEDWKERTEHNPEQNLVYNPIMEYKDEDGFKWITNYFLCEDESEISFNYYRPEVFKIVIYKDGALFKVTEKIETYAFSSNYIIDFSNETIKISTPYNYLPEIGRFMIRVFATLIIELLILAMFRMLKKSSIKTVIAINIITQIILNIILNIIIYYDGNLSAMYLLFYLEVGVFIFESIAYCLFIKKEKKYKLIGYSLVDNFLSFILGLFLLCYGI